MARLTFESQIIPLSRLAAISNPETVALKKAGVEITFHRYGGAGHAFQSFNSEEHCRHSASEGAWEKVLNIFAEKLK